MRLTLASLVLCLLPELGPIQHVRASMLPPGVTNSAGTCSTQPGRRVVGLASTAPHALSQARSGPRSVDACGILTQAELKEALGTAVRSSPVPASQPASIGVSVCMWATSDGRRTLSVTTYGPEAVQRTQTKDLKTYYESVKTSNANLARRAAVVVSGAGRHASYFINPRGAGGDVILVLRRDAVVTINASGLSRDEITKVARAAGE